MIEKPLVSVLMTAYNREKYIAEAIESVMASSYQNWELIIVDDQSKDATIEIAKSYAQKEARIKVYVNEVNLGDYPNRNKAASYAKGKYLKYLDSDDLIYSHGLEVMVNAMEKFPKAVMGIPDFLENGLHNLPYLMNSQEMYYRHFFGGGLLYTGPTGAIYLNSYFRQILGFKTEYGVSSDTAFNLEAAMLNSIVIFQRDLFWWRPHDGQEINKRFDEYEELNNRINTHYLSHIKCPLPIGDAKIALKNLKIIQARRIIKNLLKNGIPFTIKKKKALNIKLSHLVLSMFPRKLRYFLYEK
jgi:glycosyltransferase involved in cell wall biosynthesis